tara:strand:+ start:179 stop:427 length:249 start_codon:yes stop_codon:yes gene_type:complete
MITNIIKSMKTDIGRIILSIILGIGLTSLFRKSCEARNCLLFQAPPFEEINNNIYKYNNKCYKFNEHSVKCDDKNKKQVSFA